MKVYASAYGKNVEDNMDADRAKELMEKVGRAGLIACPYRVRLLRDAGDYYGECETDFNEEGTVQGHDIVLTVMNDAVLAHELAHALTNETYDYDYLASHDHHGSHFYESLTTIVKTMED